MTKIPVVFDLVESDVQIAKLMLNEIAIELNRRIPTRMRNISSRVKDATYNFLRTNNTYQSLVSGDLAAHFGIPIGGRRQRIDNIVRAVADRMEVEYTPTRLRNNQYTNGITIKVLLRNLSEVLTLSEGIVLTEKGQTLDWLRWLLTLGDTIIISEYEIQLRPGYGRSGGGIMIADEAGVWRVPPQFSGTITNNWLTRAFNDNISQYLSIIEKILADELSRI
jgi:hypothetical protein